MSGLADAIRARVPHAIWSDDLEAALVDAIARAAAARGDVHLEAAIFAGYLADRCEDQDVTTWLGRIALGDLYLACACALGDPTALAAFERELVPELHTAVARVGLSAADVADVLAEVRAKLLVHGRIRDYAGRGELRTWLRVVAIRAAISTARRLRPESDTPTELAGLVGHLGNPEAALIAQQLRKELRDAFAAAVATLEVRERNLLRQHLIDGLTSDDLARFYRVHRATAARWVAQARERVWAATVSAMQTQLAVTPAQLESMLAAVRTGLDLSLERVLATPS